MADTEYFPSTYQVPFPVAHFNEAPRFGHTDDLAGVITGSERYNDYAQGTAFTAGFILFFFVIWSVFLVLFMCCGRTVGILSGRRLLDSESSKKNVIYRTIILVCCLCTVISGIIFLVVAGNKTDDTFLSVRTGVANVAEKGDEVTRIADKVIKAGNEIIPVRDLVVKLVDRGICNSFDGGNGAQVSVDPIAQQAASALTQLSDFTMGDFTDMRNHFNSEFTAYEAEVLKVVDDTEGYINIAFYAIVVIIFAFFLAGGTYMSWFGPDIRYYFLVQTWFVVPCFFIFLLLSAIAASGIGSGLVVNSDVCMGGNDGTPESFVKAILDTQTASIDPYARSVVDHYILNGCQGGDFDAVITMKNLANEMKDALQAVTDLKTILDSGITTFEVACDGEPGSLLPVSDALGTVQYTVVSFISITEQAVEFAECQPINQIYTDFFHEGVCKNLPSALYTMFITIVLVLVFGMVIFTLRGAMLPNILDDEQDDYYYTSSRRWGNSSRSAQISPDHDDEFDYEAAIVDKPRSSMDENDGTTRDDIFMDDESSAGADEVAKMEDQMTKDTFVDNDIEVVETSDMLEIKCNENMCGDAATEAATMIQTTWKGLVSGQAHEDDEEVELEMKGAEADEDKGQAEEPKNDEVENDKEEEEKVDDAVAGSGEEEEKVDNDNEVVAKEEEDEIATEPAVAGIEEAKEKEAPPVDDSVVEEKDTIAEETKNNDSDAESPKKPVNCQVT